MKKTMIWLSCPVHTGWSTQWNPLRAPIFPESCEHPVCNNFWHKYTFLLTCVYLCRHPYTLQKASDRHPPETWYSCSRCDSCLDEDICLGTSCIAELRQINTTDLLSWWISQPDQGHWLASHQSLDVFVASQRNIQTCDESSYEYSATFRLLNVKELIYLQLASPKLWVKPNPFYYLLMPLLIESWRDARILA